MAEQNDARDIAGEPTEPVRIPGLTDQDETEETQAERDARDGYVDSPELTQAQNDELRRGKIPGELKLEVIQTLASILALIIAITALVLGIKALGIANEVKLDSVSAPSISKQIGERVDKQIGEQLGKQIGEHVDTVQDLVDEDAENSPEG